MITLQIGRQLPSEVSGSFSFSDAGLTWFSDMVHAWFGPIGICLILVVTMLLPVSTMLRYLKEYKLCGLPWAIYDVGFGLCCVSAMGLSMANDERMWYAAIPAALVLVMLGQTGGSDVV